VKRRTRMTAEQLFDLGEEVSAELVRGELREMAPPGAEHGVVVARLAWRLVQYVQDKDLGVVLVGDVGFQLASDPDTVRGPDLAFVRKDRIPPGGIPRGYWPGAPDLAVEVISPLRPLRGRGGARGGLPVGRNPRGVGCEPCPEDGDGAPARCSPDPPVGLGGAGSGRPAPRVPRAGG
jgi:hypothetical protein